MSLPKPSPLGRKLLRAAMKAMRANPSSVRMGFWLTGDPAGQSQMYECGTVGCIAGHVVLQAGKKTASVHSPNFFPKKLQETLNLKVYGGTSIGTSAARLISGNPKANYRDFRNLFFSHMWPSPFVFQFIDMSARKQQTDVVIRRMWPSPFELQFMDMSARKQQTDVVIRRIQHYLETGE